MEYGGNENIGTVPASKSQIFHFDFDFSLFRFWWSERQNVYIYFFFLYVAFRFLFPYLFREDGPTNGIGFVRNGHGFVNTISLILQQFKNGGIGYEPWTHLKSGYITSCWTPQSPPMAPTCQQNPYPPPFFLFPSLKPPTILLVVQAVTPIMFWGFIYISWVWYFG